MMLTRRALLKGGACALAARGRLRRGSWPAPRRAPRRAARCWSRSSSAARWTASAWWRRTAIAAYYARARRASRWPPPRRGDAATALDLDGYFALHPALAPLKPLWESKTLAVVHACGSPDTTRSHFDAQDYMESGHARREEHARRLAGPRRRRRCRRPAASPFRVGGAGRAAAARACAATPARSRCSSLERFDVRAAGRPG